MDPIILVAIITCPGVLVVALIALYQTKRTTKLLSETQKYVDEGDLVVLLFSRADHSGFGISLESKSFTTDALSSTATAR